MSMFRQIQIQIQVPNEVNASTQELTVMAKEALFCTLYISDKLSEVQAMNLLSLTRREFHGLLSKYNLSGLHTEEDFNDELRFSQS